MPSSTSNSERPLRVLLVAVLLAALLAAGWSAFWRRRGFVPSVIDDVNLWSVWRRRANGDPGVLALAGSSRLLMGLHLPTLRARFPDRRVVQLSLNGGSPLAVLKNLAEDDRFQGSVLCEVLPHKAYSVSPLGEVWNGYDNLPLSQRLEAPLHVYLARETNLFLPDLGLLNVLKELTKHRRLASPGIFHLDADRQGCLDFARLPPAELVRLREETGQGYLVKGGVLTGVDLQRRILEVRRLAQRIQARGGSVLFFRMISSPPVSDIQAECFPDAIYWNVFRQQVGFPCLNYADVPALTRFTCPEGAHLDQSDEPAFTAALADTLIGQHLLR